MNPDFEIPYFTNFVMLLLGFSTVVVFRGHSSVVRNYSLSYFHHIQTQTTHRYTTRSTLQVLGCNCNQDISKHDRIRQVPQLCHSQEMEMEMHERVLRSSHHASFQKPRRESSTMRSMSLEIRISWCDRSKRYTNEETKTKSICHVRQDTLQDGAI